MRQALVVFTLIIWNLSSLDGQGFLKTKGQQIVNEKGENILLRGMGLGGWMLQEGYMLKIQHEGQQYRIRQRIDSLIGKEKAAAFYEMWLNNHTTKADIDSLKKWGFNSVRLPIHYNLFTLAVEDETTPGENTWLTRGFELTDQLVSWCKANGIYLILDLHAAPGGQGNDLNISDRNPSTPSLWESEANQQKTIALWKKLAERYVNETTIIAYDIINEPNWGFEDPIKDNHGVNEKKNLPLKKLLKEITQAIRTVDKNHIIIIEGNGWGNNYQGILDDGLWDNNMVLSFHKYWSYNDVATIQYILDYRKKHQVPVWIGETGENSNVWFTEAVKLMESHNIGWAWWPLKKLGFNNPLQIKKPEGYDQIVDYWNGKAELLEKVDVAKCLMTLAKNTNIKFNDYHKDVVDALMRQPHDNATQAYHNHTLSNKLDILAIHYDLGRQGFAYYDKDTANYWVSGQNGVGNKGSFLRNDGVDIFKEEKESYYVGSFEEGEWMLYTIDVKEGGNYLLNLEYRSNERNSSLMVSSPNADCYIKLYNFQDDNKWKFSPEQTISLTPGKTSLMVKMISGKAEVKKLSLKKK